ncbi:MAG: hypothetical protein ACXVEE_06575 [Polyangiales bacterium]
MAKKPNVSIRKASSAPQNEVVRAGFRGLTIYLPDALAERFDAYCKQGQKDPSALMTELLTKHFEALDAPPAPQPKATEKEEGTLAMLMKWIESKIPKMLRPAWL